MLTEYPANGIAWTTQPVWDITERRPIPKGEQVTVEDYDRSGNLFVVEWEGRIYLATPDELR